MKRILLLVIPLIILLSVFMVNDKTFAVTEENYFYIEGEQVTKYYEPMKSGGAMYFPLEPIIEYLGGEYEYLDLYETAEFSLSNGDKFIAPLDAWFILLNDKKVAISTLLINEVKFPGDERLISRDDDLMAPKEFIKDVLGVEIKLTKAKSTNVYYIGDKPTFEVEKEDSKKDGTSNDQTDLNKSPDEGSKGNNKVNSDVENDSSNLGNANEKSNSNNNESTGSFDETKDNNNKDSNKDSGSGSETNTPNKEKEESTSKKFDISSVLNTLKSNGYRVGDDVNNAYYSHNLNYFVEVSIQFFSDSKAKFEVRDWPVDPDDPDADDLTYLEPIPEKTRIAVNTLFPNDGESVFNEIKSYKEKNKTNSFIVKADGWILSFSNQGGSLIIDIK